MMAEAPVAAPVPERRRVHRTVLQGHQVLAYFWMACRAEDANALRLDLLCQLSAVAVPRPEDWDPKAVRAAFQWRPYPETGCFSCFNRGRKMAWHHIIAIDHGGSNWIWNQVAVCHVCHRRIHPWLDEEPDNGRWTTPAELVRALATDRLRLKKPRPQVHNDDWRWGDHSKRGTELDRDEHELWKRGEWE